MRRLTTTAWIPAVLTAVALVAGCGEEGNSEVTASPEAKKADTGAQDAMKEFMQTKSAKPKGKSAAPAPAPAPAPPAEAPK
jgi:hypothetical protein